MTRNIHAELTLHSGWASQWYPSPFTVKIRFTEEGEEEKVTFPSAEHWMMVQKAVLFGDGEMAREILAVESMSQVKSLGREIKNFNEEKWVAERERIVLEGNIHKFEQNEELRKKLVGTGTKMIVETSPRDRIWGVGFGEKNALNMKERWGLNLLGKALVETRRRIIISV